MIAPLILDFMCFNKYFNHDPFAFVTVHKLTPWMEYFWEDFLLALVLVWTRFLFQFIYLRYCWHPLCCIYQVHFFHTPSFKWLLIFMLVIMGGHLKWDHWRWELRNFRFFSLYILAHNWEIDHKEMVGKTEKVTGTHQILEKWAPAFLYHACWQCLLNQPLWRVVQKV